MAEPLTIDRPLTALQQRFVAEYVADGSSITAAAKRAGYAVDSADNAYRLLEDPRVRTAIDEANSRAAKLLGISAERVLQELWKVAGANPGDVVQLDSEGADIDPKGAGEVMVTTVSGNGKKVRSVTSKTVKPADKIAALEKIAKMLNFYPKEEAVQVNLSLSELIERSMDSSSKELSNLVSIVQEDVA